MERECVIWRTVVLLMMDDDVQRAETPPMARWEDTLVLLPMHCVSLFPLSGKSRSLIDWIIVLFGGREGGCF